MTDMNVYKDIEILLTNFESLSKDEIREQLMNILPEPCKNCNVICSSIEKYGKELDPDARYDAAEALYTICSNCKCIQSSTY